MADLSLAKPLKIAGSCVVSFLALGCDSPTDLGMSNATAPHEPWARRECASQVPTFEASTSGGSPLLDLCSLAPADLQASGALSDVPAAQARAASIVAKLSQSEKLALVEGASGAYVGNVPAIGELPALALQDGPAGVARFSDVTAFPAPIALAATWDLDLVERWGAAMAAEERGKGAQIQLGPMMNLARVPRAGRNFEGFGEDPFLAAALAARDVTGIQSQKVIATAKHYVGNEQETLRVGSDSRIDERTLHELYYAPFAASIEAGAGAVMCSYNRLNGDFACESTTSLRDLKTGLGFSGFVMSDWGATQSLEASANAGLDLEMPLGHWFGKLGAAIDAGSVPQARLDDMVTRIVTSLARVGVLDEPVTGTPNSPVTSDEHVMLARQAAAESVTLLKNETGILPLAPSQSVLVVGPGGNTSPSAVGGGSAFVNASYVTSPLAALQARGVTVKYDDGTSDSVTSAASAVDVALVFVTVPASEGQDRPSLATGQDDLIARVASANPNTIVILNSPGAVLMPWLGVVRGVVLAWYPGQENGAALASVLYGDQNPSGKLPLSFPANENDLPTPDASPTVHYDEGLAIGYRALDRARKTPLFPFGFGLSYTSFAYSALRLTGGLDGSLEVSFALGNIGTRAGSEVAQLYLSFPAAAGEPPRVLRGFTRASLAAGETRVFTTELPPRAFACWDANAHHAFVPSGSYHIAVGGSSRDLPLGADFQVAGTD